MRTIFHITTQSEWNTAHSNGYYETPSLFSEGFIHFSRPHQVLKVANDFFRGQRDLVLLFVNQEKISAEIRYEGNDVNKFPHLYGRLNLDAVISQHPFSEQASRFSLPQPFVMVGDTLIRPGQPGDESELASVHTHGWQQSYKGIIPEEFLNSRPLSYRARLLWWKSVVDGKTPTTVFVAESAQHGIVGFNAVEPSRDKAFPEYGEVVAIYCLNEYKKKGIGAALFQVGLECLRQKGFKDSFCWVLKENPTVEFYRRMGGEGVDKEKTVELGKPLVEIAYKWRL
jgi:uncharacterized protein (DUF952 family)/L-amino acid N-acyltransferase YncA